MVNRLMQLIALLLLLSLGSCAHKPVAPLPDTKPLPPAVLQHPPLPSPLQLVEMRDPWLVLTTDVMVARIALLDSGLADSLKAFYAAHPEQRFTYFAMTPKDYGTLSQNSEETLRFIRDLRGTLDYYRKLPR